MRTNLHNPQRNIGRAAIGIGAAALLGLSACGTDDAGDTSPQDETETSASAEQGSESADAAAPAATASVRNEAGDELGTVSFAEVDGDTEVSADFEGLSPGFHGFHIHGTGQCEPEGTNDEGEPSAFQSAGSHFNPEDAEHPDHAGDMPPLLVTEDGTATISFHTDRFTPEDLGSGEGTAVMIHSGPDNFANIPERYTPAPDEDSLGAGDAGDRVGCGVVETA